MLWAGRQARIVTDQVRESNEIADQTTITTEKAAFGRLFLAQLAVGAQLEPRNQEACLSTIKARLTLASFAVLVTAFN